MSQLKRMLMSDVWLLKKGKSKGKERLCVQRVIIQQEDTLLFPFLICNNLVLTSDISQSLVAKLCIFDLSKACQIIFI